MRNTHILVVTLLTTALAACGSSGPSPATSEAAHKAAVASLPANASTVAVAAHMRGDVDCPPELPPVAKETPVDDIVGVRPGLTYEQAANAVMCSNKLLVISPNADRGFDIKTYGHKIRQGFSAHFAKARVAKTGRQIMQEMNQELIDRENNAVRQDMQPGQAKWFVATMGMPGKEKVISAARELWFDKGRNPTVDSVAQSLIAKYGQPTSKQEQTGSPIRQLLWAYGPRGRKITETSPLYGRCHGMSDPDQGVSLSPICGISVQATIVSLSNNLELARYLQVGVVDFAGGYTALTSTEQGLQALDVARQAKEVKKAAKNAEAVQY
jgi:hypothetical protein